MTNDENFIIDFLPNSTDVIIMSPCSGRKKILQKIIQYFKYL